MKSLYFLLIAILLVSCSTITKTKKTPLSPEEEFLKKHPGLSDHTVEIIQSPEILKSIQNKQISFNYTKEMVQLALGAPKKIYGYQIAGKDIEIWTYSDFYWQPYENILFEDRKVVRWNFPKTVKDELDQRADQEMIAAVVAPPTEEAE